MNFVKTIQTTLTLLMFVLATMAFKEFQAATKQVDVIAAGKICIMAVGVYLAPALALGYSLVKWVFVL